MSQIPSSSTAQRPNLNLPEIKPRVVSSNSSLDSGNSTGASTVASSLNYSIYSNTPSTNAGTNSARDTPMGGQTMSMLNMSMDDPMSSLMADAPGSLESSISGYANSTTAQQSSQVITQPQQAPQQSHSHPALTTLSSVDYSTTIDSINFLPLVTSNNQNQPQPIASSNVQFNSTMMPIVPQQTPSNTISDEAVAQIVSNTSVPEFLYQLTKMLTDDHRDIIEWSNAKIEVHNPHRLESEVLNKYFRHSKYASFQRQLNYFGFRKLAGKGKMAPCSYVNENATTDLRSLLRMKVRFFLSFGVRSLFLL